ncbi:MAG: pantoate--beta-alanine ligase [Dehalococcoidia bacterium]
MQVLETVADMREAREKILGRISLVPTMGALHAGHEELLERARAVSDVVLASLFVNPTQFAPGEDFKGYPRDPDRDLGIFERHGVEAVFAPGVEEMYPEGDVTRVDPGPIGAVLEGAHRPGHFVGVATVVTKLFNVVRPHAALFGEKDAQQFRIIRRLNEDLRLGIEIVGVPTVRADDGLALSSRNAYLAGENRRAATVLYRALVATRKAWEDGVRDAGMLRQCMHDALASEPLAKPDYVSVADPETLQELDLADGSALASLAVRVGPARLIDNFLLTDG